MVSCLICYSSFHRPHFMCWNRRVKLFLWCYKIWFQIRHQVKPGSDSPTAKLQQIPFPICFWKFGDVLSFTGEKSVADAWGYHPFICQSIFFLNMQHTWENVGFCLKIDHLFKVHDQWFLRNHGEQARRQGGVQVVPPTAKGP